MTVCRDDRGKPGRADVAPLPDGTRVYGNSDYDPAYCELVIKLGLEGHSYAEMCVAMDASKRKAQRWRDKYEEFDEAVEQGLTAYEAHLNKIGTRNMEWVNAKGEPQLRSEVWKEFKAECRPVVKTENAEASVDEAKFNEIKDKYMKQEV